MILFIFLITMLSMSSYPFLTTLIARRFIQGRLNFLFKLFMYAVFKVQYGWLFVSHQIKRTSILSHRWQKIFFEFRRPPALPNRLQLSTIGRPGLNRRVRDGNGCSPRTYRHRKVRVTKVSAPAVRDGVRKLASRTRNESGGISDAVATERAFRARWHLRLTPLITQQ